MTKYSLIAIFAVIISCQTWTVSAWLETPHWYNELFGDGDFHDESSQLVEKHLSSSTEDLIILFNAERKLAQLLSQIYRTDESYQFVDNYLKSIDFDVNDNNLDAEHYVSHPVNAFHLMKRTANWMPKIKLQLLHSETLKLSKEKDEMIELLASFVLPEKKDFEFGASYGLILLQDFHQFDIKRLAQGILDNFDNTTHYKANSRLSSEELLIIATIARNVHKLNSHVSWGKEALEAAKLEGKTPAFTSKIKKMISQGQFDHDEEIIRHGFFHTMSPEDPTSLVYTNYEPYGKGMKIFTEFNKAKKAREAEEKIFSTHENLVQEHPRKWKTGQHGFKAFKMSYFLYPKTQRLCRGEHVRPAHLVKDLFCFHLHHNDPYLRLGPFKYERLHENIEIGLFHDFATEYEMENLKSRARGHMKSTPYVVSNNKEEAHSRFRTSKVIYMNEHKEDAAKKLSDKIEKATRFKLYNDNLDSENYQIMNYGIGGTISGHVDSSGPVFGSSEYYGGTRMTTFMIYLSEVPLGGHTVFPQPGITVKPVKGNALYWFNHDTLEENDTRSYHLGCPVGFGNKWIANKWVKWTGQMWNYPCGTRKRDFSIEAKKKEKDVIVKLQFKI